MGANVSVRDPEHPKRVAIVASSPAVSRQTGWPIGFWWAELAHPYWEFTERGYAVTIASPDGGALQADSWSDPRDPSGYASDDLLSLGFLSSPRHAPLLEQTPALGQLDLAAFDGVLLVGGQGPMFTFFEDERVHRFVRDAYEARKVTGVLCHATCVLLKTRLSDGRLLAEGKTWTGFSNAEEDYADAYVRQRVQPFRIEDEARRIGGTNFIVGPRFAAHAVRDGTLITGQQQYSAAAAARLMIEALGV
jgi:putative intracellular protease/amidase